MAAARVVFITNTQLVDLPEGQSSPLASVRREILLPARALAERGIATHTLSLQSWPAEQVREIAGKADRVVFGKLLAAQNEPPQQRYAGDARAYRQVLDGVDALASRAVFCFADDHFDEPHFAAFYRTVAPASRAWIACSAALQQRLLSEARCPVLVYPEMAEVERGTPRTPRRGLRVRGAVWLARRARVGIDPWRLRLLWFGHPTNVDALLEALPELERCARAVPLAIECVTQAGTPLDELVTPPAAAASAPLRITLSPWSLAYMPLAFEECDAVILPQRSADPKKRAKSNNRLVDAIQAGRFALAHPIPAYEELASFAWVGESLAEGLRWLLREPDEALRRLVEGQRHIDEHHSLSALGEFWMQALELEPPRETGRAPTRSALRDTLYRRREPFFAVYAKDWLQRSAGRRALHLLAHALNKRGVDAYVANCSVVNPQLFTPMLSGEEMAALRAAGRPCVAIYPEVIHDDPLGADLAVRWLLNRPGQFRKDFPGRYGRNDLHFFWSREFHTLAVEAWPLILPHIDTSIFHNDDNPLDVKRSGHLVFARKYLDRGHEIEPQLLEGSIDISLRAPEYRSIPPQELARLFRSARYLVSYEESSTCQEAMLCGCPIVYRTSGYLSGIPASHGPYGATTSLREEDIARARAGLPRYREAYMRLFESAESQIDFLIDLCRKRLATV